MRFCLIWSGFLFLMGFEPLRWLHHYKQSWLDLATFKESKAEKKRIVPNNVELFLCFNLLIRK